MKKKKKSPEFTTGEVIGYSIICLIIIGILFSATYYLITKHNRIWDNLTENMSASDEYRFVDTKTGDSILIKSISYPEWYSNNHWIDYEAHDASDPILVKMGVDSIYVKEKSIYKGIGVYYYKYEDFKPYIESCEKLYRKYKRGNNSKNLESLDRYFIIEQYGKLTFASDFLLGFILAIIYAIHHGLKKELPLWFYIVVLLLIINTIISFTLIIFG